MTRALRPAVLCAATILAWAWVDTIIWRLMFEPHQTALRAAYGQAWLDTYHWGWADMLRWMCTIGVIAFAMMREWRAAIWFWPATWALANSGLEDVLYYWLSGQAVPARLEWLDGKSWAFAPVTPAVIGVSVAGHVLMAVLLWMALGWAGNTIGKRRLVKLHHVEQGGL